MLALRGRRSAGSDTDSVMRRDFGAFKHGPWWDSLEGETDGSQANSSHKLYYLNTSSECLSCRQVRERHQDQVWSITAPVILVIAGSWSRDLS